MWIGVVSDTYGDLHPRVVEVLDGVDFILHCGNIGDVSVLEALSHCAPVSGVLGQVDRAAEFDGVLTKSLLRNWSDVQVYVTHHLGSPLELLPGPQREIEEGEPDLILFGATHEGYNNRVDGRHFLNPGSAARRGRRGAPSVALLELNGKTIRGEIIPLDT